VIAYQDIGNNDLKVVKCANAACTAVAATTMVDSAGGSDTSIAIGADGFPVIAYRAAGSRVAKCANAGCTGASTITTIDSAVGAGTGTSIIVRPDGTPLISYGIFDGASSKLRVARCANSSCTGTATIATVDASPNTARAHSMAIGVDGLPVIAYDDAGYGDLKVAKCRSAHGVCR
jgi:hypothetical protein